MSERIRISHPESLSHHRHLLHRSQARESESECESDSSPADPACASLYPCRLQSPAVLSSYTPETNGHPYRLATSSRSAQSPDSAHPHKYSGHYDMQRMRRATNWGWLPGLSTPTHALFPVHLPGCMSSLPPSTPIDDNDACGAAEEAEAVPRNAHVRVHAYSLHVHIPASRALGVCRASVISDTHPPTVTIPSILP